MKLGNCTIVARGAAGAAALVLSSASTAAPTQLADPPPVVLTVLSYNVKGLPWPAAKGRAAAAGRIAATLAAMRTAGNAPQVVVVQEAFGPEQRGIGRAAGYAFTVFGPNKHLEGQEADSPEEQTFLRQARPWHGEAIGRFANSGLAVFSDYPVLWSKRLSFGEDACAGWDCLANKGVLAVALVVPGQAKPVVVIDTHLNARRAAHVAPAREAAAYDAEIAKLSTFVRSFEPLASAIVLGGDFNVGNDDVRGHVLGGTLLTDTGLELVAEEKSCGPRCRVPVEVTPGQAPALVPTKSLLAYRNVTPDALSPQGAVGTFGTLPDGKMLSDHVGISVRFAVAQ